MGSIGIGIGAGLVAALLFGVVITGSPLAMLLSYVAPLPVLIASLGWRHRSGLLAAAAGGIVTAITMRPEAGLAFVIGWALPAWWIAYLALLGRPGNGIVEWYPLGRLLLWMAGVSGLITLAGIVAIGDGDVEAYRTVLRRTIAAVLRAGMSPDAGAVPDSPASSDALADILVGVVPLVASAVFLLIFTLNLWLAAKAVQISGRLPRPWPFIPATAMPRSALAVLAGAAILCVLPGFWGVAGLSLLGAVTIAFALQGLALLHLVTRERTGRGAILGVTYVLVLFVGHTVLPLFAVLGAADTAFALRNRFRLGPAGPGSPSP